MICRSVAYAGVHTYRPVSPPPAPELALIPEQVLQVRRFCGQMRSRKPIGIVDAYGDDQGRALCPAAIGINHYIGPDGDIFKTVTAAAHLHEFHQLTAGATCGCFVLERPSLLREFVHRHGLRDTTVQQTARAELSASLRPIAGSTRWWTPHGN